ncbi:WG repeat-containing protein [Clostridium sp.]|uniref:WG repeat-containing protein n=1 Tax=Clostridium sp. TaxID=1506 RepID=UPI00260C4DC5|nr:WG repeat-containing protein [Clostridium sp.]
MSSNKNVKKRKTERKKSKEKILSKKRFSENDKIYPALKNAKEGKVYGYINESGVFVIEPVYLNAYDFNSNGLAIVQEGEKFGLINNKGEYVLKPTYDSLSEFKENRSIFVREDYMGVIDDKGNTITKEKYNFINDYNDGRAIIGVSSNTGDYKYGYIDLEGNVVISPIYSEANNFNEGVALVKGDNKKYTLINTSGKVIKTYNHNYISQYGEGLMVFGDSFEGPLGYINTDGQVVIKPNYKSAEAFENGVAKVSESDSFTGPYGLINKEGNYVYEPIFNDIKIIGEGRVTLGMPIGESDFKPRSVYAIGDTKGNILTGFIYLVVGEYKNGLAYASNETDTFFIDLYGKEDKKLPKVNGSGELSIKNGLIYADIDYSPYYLDKLGKVIYKPNDVINLDNSYSVLKEKYKPNINYLIYNPVVKGVKDKKVESQINIKLKELSYFRPYNEDGNQKLSIITEDDVLDYDYYGDFNIKYFKKDLLNLDINGYYYPIGAAHGMPSKKTPTIDLVTGKFHTLGDLFMGGVYWAEELNKIIKNMIETDKMYEYVFKDEFKGIKQEQDFYIDDNNLYIYFLPYEIGPYSAGFITFKIPFSEIQGILNWDLVR